MMYTLCSNYYMDKAVFREDTFYLVSEENLVEGIALNAGRVPRIFHWCSELAKLQEDNVGLVFLSDDVKDMTCSRCKKSPGDDIITVYTMLKEK